MATSSMRPRPRDSMFSSRPTRTFDISRTLPRESWRSSSSSGHNGLSCSSTLSGLWPPWTPSHLAAVSKSKFRIDARRRDRCRAVRHTRLSHWSTRREASALSLQGGRGGRRWFKARLAPSVLPLARLNSHVRAYACEKECRRNCLTGAMLVADVTLIGRRFLPPVHRHRRMVG
jgi:hypothetical protein